MSNHARLGPSNHRWPHCPGSVREEAAYPDIAGDAAIDGTGSHLLLEMCLNHGEDASFFLDSLIGVNDVEKPGGWMVDIERAARVQMCLDYIERRVTELELEYLDADISVEAETRSNPGTAFDRDDWWGTVDVTITVKHSDVVKFIEVVDYKDGRGWVHAERNSQLVSYLGGKIASVASFDAEVVRTTIVQPKTQPPIRYWDTTPLDLMTELNKLAVAAAATDAPDAPLVAGKHCTWCKHKPNCTKQTEGSVEIVKEMTNMRDIDVFSENPANLPTEKLSKLMSAKEGIMVAFDKIEEEIKNRIEKGENVPGWAMLPGNSRRIWNTTDDEIAKALRGRRMKDSDIYIRSLISPAQCLKLPNSVLTERQKETIERELITNLAGKLTLKKVSKKEQKEAKELFADVVQPQTISFL